jgi:antitoxin component YwqK of YwqJK toxin-antitoxin module
MKYIALFVFSLGMIGCRGKQKNLVKYKSGNPEIVAYYDSGSDSTTYRKDCLYESGKMEYTGKIIRGVKEGIWIWWYENGNKKDQCKFLHGKEIDTIFHWHENGNPKRIDVLRNGNINPSPGVSCTICCNINSTLFYENGRVQKTFTYMDGRQQDTAKDWFPNGNLKSINFFKDDIENGLAEDYYPNGQIKFRSLFKDGCQDGQAIEWDSLGKIKSQAFWKDKKIVKSQ